MFTAQTLQKRILAAYKRLNNWRAVADEFGVNVGTAYRVAHGYEPKDAHIRHALHLPAMLPAPACPHCGEVHIKHSCPNRRLPDPWNSAVEWLAEREKRMG